MFTDNQTLPCAAEKESNDTKTDWRKLVPTVSQLTRRLRGHIENSFFDVWVKGEISNFRKPVSGHAYFILKDSTAQLRAVLFRPVLSKLKFQLEDGMEVLLHGKVTIYEARGEYQMVCDTLEPVGAGALQLAFEQLKTKLQKEGLFDEKYKKPLPFLPSCIGIITSSTGAAVRDILNVLGRRFENRSILVIPASVQGEKAAGEIVVAIKNAERFNCDNPTRPVEVLIIGRGGGSLEDLWSFNEEIVARAIFDCPIPIISAVGHEIDFTIADFVADVRAPTPSAAAEIVVPRKEDLIYTVQQQSTRLERAIQKTIEQLRLHLTHLSQRLVDPRRKIRELHERFGLLHEKLHKTMVNQLKLLRARLCGTVEKLHTLSPLAVLARGYSITRDKSGNIIKSINNVEISQNIVSHLNDGILVSRVLQKSMRGPS